MTRALTPFEIQVTERVELQRLDGEIMTVAQAWALLQQQADRLFGEVKTPEPHRSPNKMLACLVAIAAVARRAASDMTDQGLLVASMSGAGAQVMRKNEGRIQNAHDGYGRLQSTLVFVLMNVQTRDVQTLCGSLVRITSLAQCISEDLGLISPDVTGEMEPDAQPTHEANEC